MLRLLSFPSLLDKALSRLLSLQSKLGALFSHFSSLTGVQASESSVQSTLEQLRATTELVNAQFKDAARTTLIALCIADCLSLYETERLVQELASQEIDIHNIVLDQVSVMEKGSECRKCRARQRMQSRYLDDIDALYGEDVCM